MSVRANILWYGAPRVLNRFAALILLPLYTRVLLPEEFGAAMVAIAVGAVSAMVVGPGVEALYIRAFIRSSGGAALGSVAIVHAFTLAAGSGVLLLFGGPISSLLLPGIPVTFYYTVVCSTALTTLAAPVRAEWRALHQAKLVAILDAVVLVISTSTIVVSLLRLDQGALSILLGDLVAGLVIAPLALWKLFGLLTRGTTRDQIRETAGLMAATVPMAIYGYAFVTLDRLLIQRFAGESEVAVYAVGYSLGAVILVSAALLNKEWAPLVINLAGSSEPQPEALQNLWMRSVSIFFLLGALVTVLAQDLVPWYAGPEYARSALVVPWIALGGILRTIRIFSNGLGLTLGRSRDLFIESTVSMGIFVAASFVLIPRMGSVGAAVAGVAAYAAGSAFLMTRSWNVYQPGAGLLLPAGVFVACFAFSAFVDIVFLSVLAGMSVLVLLLVESFRYWRFLGTLRPAGVL